MMEAGRDSDALAHLVIHRESILDTQSLLEMTGASSNRLKTTFRLKERDLKMTPGHVSIKIRGFKFFNRRAVVQDEAVRGLVCDLRPVVREES